MTNQLLIYGCNGYTGSLISREAVRRGLRPILAGRNAAAVKVLADELQCEWRAFDLSETEKLKEALRLAHTVLHCAGPFQYTSETMIHACLETGTHYLDITGEIGVFENAFRYNEAATRANLLVMPGVGFDVVPTDCLSLFLKKQLPAATSLELAIMQQGGRLSHGTAITVVETLDQGSASRVNGKITPSKSGSVTRTIDFDGPRRLAVEIPWGDVSTAYRTTGIPNIRVYNVLPLKLISRMKWSNWLRPFLALRFVKDRAIKAIKQRPAGPTEAERQSGKTFIWGEVADATGKQVQAMLWLGEGYQLTAETAVELAFRVLNGNISARGYQTPAAVVGEDFILNYGTRKLLP
ncbi:MAG: saccharopine dehydrogenase NADP-binding domain-containing protein [Chitinophagales bacterium]